jgi:hypothetical protein
MKEATYDITFRSRTSITFFRITALTLLILMNISGTVSATYTTIHPHDGNIYWVGADSKMISLVNNNQAKNPTYSQLLTFLKADTTDQKRYTSTYNCGDFAETLHNNAEKKGYKAGWVALPSIKHACNVFKTTDKGLVYVDCTGIPSGSNKCYDTKVSVAIGKQYKRVPLFCSNVYFPSIGTVKDFKVYW